MALAVPSSHLPHVFSCNWEWCPYSSLIAAQLREHVITHHVDQATPIRQGDLPEILRAEEGLGETMSIGDKMAGLCSPTQEEFVPTSKPDSQPLEEPSSSLPSPPRSHHSSVSPRTNTTLLRSEPQPTFTLNAEPEPPSHVELGLCTGPDAFSTPQSRRYLDGFAHVRTPSFADLTSPTKPYDLPIPSSPGLEKRIQSALRPGKRRHHEYESFDPGPSKKPIPTSTSFGSNASSSSSRSINSVQEQLTQLAPEEEDAMLGQFIHTDRLEYPSEGFSQVSTHAEEIFHSRGLNSQVSTTSSQQSLQSLQPPPPGQPREPYTPFLTGSLQHTTPSDDFTSRPTRENVRSRLFNFPSQFSSSGSESQSRRDPFGSSQPDAECPTEKKTTSRFYSGILPSLNKSKQRSKNTSSPHKPPVTSPIPLSSSELSTGLTDACKNVVDCYSEDEETSQDFSYPPLQTQAPYQSQ